MVNVFPRRTAHATYALMAASKAHNSPVTAAEVCIYDSEARSVRSTAAALREAQVSCLAVSVPSSEGGRLWVPTNIALDARQDFEDRYLDDTDGAL